MIDWAPGDPLPAPMAKPKQQLLFHAEGTRRDGTNRRFSVYTYGATVLIRMQGRPVRHLCPTHVQTEDQIKQEIHLVFDVVNLTITRPT